MNRSAQPNTMPFRAILLLLWFCFCMGTCDAEKPLRIISYNVWYGFTKVPERKPAFLKWMTKQAPDVVSLQELNGYTNEKLAEDAKTWGHRHSVLLKTQGFPTGITSREPIEDIQRTFEGFHHGLLRVRIGGIYFYVIHLHPSNWEARGREAGLILKDIASLPEGSEIILAGDFNTFSDDDAKYYQHGKLEPFFSKRDEQYSEKNLREGKLDYSVIDRFQKAGLVDLENSRRGTGFVFSGSFPTRIEKPGDHGSPRRLDYIFATRGLARRVTHAKTVVTDITWILSDHLPVIVEMGRSSHGDLDR